MTRLIAGFLLGSCVFAVLYFATVRTERHPLLIDAASQWCSYRPQGPLVTPPQHNYDYQPARRRTGATA